MRHSGSKRAESLTECDKDQKEKEEQRPSFHTKLKLNLN